MLLIFETKLVFSFSFNLFHIDGFTISYRLDRNQNSGSIMLCITEDIPSKSSTEMKLDNEIGNIFFGNQFNLKKWLISGFCNPKLSHMKNHFQATEEELEYYSSKYEDFIVLGDFNVAKLNPHMSELCSVYNLINLIMEPTCYKNVNT